MTAPSGNGATVYSVDALVEAGTLNTDPVALPPTKRGRDEFVVSINVAGGGAETAIVQIQGSLDSGVTWFDMLTAAHTEANDSDAYALAFVPMIRASISGVTNTPDIDIHAYWG